jgi:hypothetical protein
MEHMSETKWKALEADFMRDIYKGMIATNTSADRVTLEKADGTKSLELTHIPLKVWEHIGIDGKAIIEAIRAKRNEA